MTSKGTRSSSARRVIFAPDSHERVFAGVDKLVSAIRPTLGPLGGTVLIESALRWTAPEVLDDGGTIAQRITPIKHPAENMGAMLLRSMLHELHETVGDGAATAAVLFQAALRTSRRLIAAGVNAMELRQQIEQAADRTCEALCSQVEPLNTREAIERCALAICHDVEMAALLGEIFDITGGDGYVRVFEWERCGLDREYVEGSLWTGTWASPYMITDMANQEAILADPAVFVSDLRLTTPDDVRPAMQAALSAGRGSLLVLAEEVSGQALNTLLVNHQAGALKILAIKSTSYFEKANLLEDLALLTGARPLREATGDSSRRVTANDLGTAQRAWATTTDFGVSGGGGDPYALRQHISALRQRLLAATTRGEVDPLRKRLGKLLGGVVRLRVGGTTEPETKERVGTARRTVSALHLAMDAGVVPGGGSGLLRCADALRETAGDQLSLGSQVLARALEEPLRVIAANAGHEPSPVVEQVRAAPPGWGFDAVAGAVVDLRQVGIMDPAPVLEAAVQTAARSAALLLTTDVLVYPAKTWRRKEMARVREGSHPWNTPRRPRR
jgi:chaperonin GroEL